MKVVYNKKLSPYISTKKQKRFLLWIALILAGGKNFIKNLGKKKAFSTIIDYLNRINVEF